MRAVVRRGWWPGSRIAQAECSVVRTRAVWAGLLVDNPGGLVLILWQPNPCFIPTGS